jgi:hypothetical protein
MLRIIGMVTMVELTVTDNSGEKWNGNIKSSRTDFQTLLINTVQKNENIRKITISTR